MDVDKLIEKVTQVRKVIIKVPGIKQFDAQIRKSAGLAVKGMQSVASSSDSVGAAFKRLQKITNPNAFLAGTFQSANQGAISLLETLSRTTIVLFGITSAFKTLQATASAFYNETIGRANAYYEQLLKTKTTLASTNDVFVNEKKILDPLEKIESISGLIDSRIDSIRLKTIELAGVTSGEVVEVFSIVASQAGQIGANLEQAEDLAISFAAALGTFGLPLRQARQEITSILQGNVNVDSYIAQALQITSSDIQKARSQIGGISAYLQKKLETAVAGQSLAAKTLEGVLSNIRDIYEEFTRNIGDVQLQPLIKAWSFIFETLNKSLATIKSIGREMGKLPVAIGTGITNAAGFNQEGNSAAAAEGVTRVLEKVDVIFSKLQVNITQLMNQLNTQLGAIMQNIATMIGLLTNSLGQFTEAVAILTRAQIESFVGTLAQVIPILTGAVLGVSALISAWAELLKLPIVQAFVRLKTTFKLLEMTGVLAVARIVTKIIIFRKMLMGTWNAIVWGITMAKAGIAAVLVWISKLLLTLSALIAKITAVAVASGIISSESTKDIDALSDTLKQVGEQAQESGSKIKLMGIGIKGLANAFKGLLKATLIIAAVQLAIAAVVESLSAYQRYRDQLAKDKSLENSIKYLDETAEQAAKGGLTSLQEKLRELAQRDVREAMEEAVAKIKELKDELKDLGTDESPLMYGGAGAIDTKSLKRSKAQIELEKWQKKYKALEAKLDKKNVDEKVRLESNNRKNLEKEVAEFRKQLADDEFRYRQRLARAEVEKLRLQQQLELQRLDAILKKRIEGEEGASRAFMENLNNYLRKKQQGEDDINAREKSLQLDLADLAKEIADYKYNTEKKIAALQEKMGIYQMKVADYKYDKAKEQETNLGQAGSLVKLIADSESYGGNYGAFNRAGSNEGHTAHGSGIDPNLVTRTIADIMAEQARGEIHAVGKYQIIGKTMKGLMSGAYGATGVTPDMQFTPANQDKLFQALARNRIVSNNPEATMAGLRQEWIGLQNIPDEELMPAVKAMMEGGSSLVTPAKAQAPEPLNLGDLSDVDPSKITSSLEKLKTTMTEIKALKDELTMEDIAQTFEDLANGVFGQIDLEPLNDQLKTAQEGFNSMVESGKELTDNQQRQIEYQTILKRAETERDQMIKAVNENQELSDEKKIEAIAIINESYDKHVEKLEKVRETQAQILGLEQARAAIAQSIANIESITAETADLKLETRLQMEGLSSIEIRGELKKAQIYRQQAKILATSNMTPEQKAKYVEQIQREITAVNALTKAQMEAANPINRLYAQWKQDLNDIDGMYAQMAQTVASELGTAMSNAITGLIDGTKTAEEAFADMFKNIGKAFIDMATQMIAKALVMKALGILLPGAGAAPAQGFGGTNYGMGFSNLFSGGGVPFSYAEGGFVETPQKANIADGGEPEYVIPESKMNDAMGRWSSGSRGGDVLDPMGTGGGEGGFGMGGDDGFNSNITINGGITQIGGQDYIRRDELPSIVGQAAKAGEDRALRKLRMSPSARRKIGL